MRGLTYFLRSNLYITLTNECNAFTSLYLRGANFKMPEASGFQPLEEGVEPTAEDILKAVDEAFDAGKISVSSMESEPITFAGAGEPLLRLGVLTSAAELIKDKRHGVPIRVKTNGLILSKDAAMVATDLKSAGVDQISINLASDNPKTFQEIVGSKTNANFGDVCSFVIACSEAGLDTTCTAVERPGVVDLSKVRGLALSLGATGFNHSTYHP